MIANDSELLMVIATGIDKRGIIASMSKAMFNGGYNIVDAKQNVIHGQFLLIFIIEPTEALVDNPIKFLEDRFDEISAGTEINITIKNFRGGLRSNVKKYARVAWFGPDRAGMIAAISNLTGKNEINVVGTNMTARGELISCEFTLDIGSSIISLEGLRKELDKLGEQFKIDFLLQAENYHDDKKKLIVFDMIPVLELDYIDKLVRAYPKDLKLSEFDHSERHNIQDSVKGLAGLHVDVLNEFVECIEITPETIELVRSVQSMNFKIALISHGFTQFSDHIAKQLHLDYNFGSRLEMNNGILTGEFDKEAFIDNKKKEKILGWLASLEQISMEAVEDFGEVVQKKTYDIEKAEFGISFTLNAGKILTLMKSGKLSMKQFKGIIGCLAAFL
jgi:phosphoserine phosphatase/glycine cleavage system regulatory protein